MNYLHKELKSILPLNGSTAPLPQLPPLGGEEADTDEDLTETMRCNNLHLIVKAIKEKNVHNMRQQASIAQYKLYCELCYPVIVGKQKWKMNHTQIGIKTLTTVADEAFVALVLENNVEEWIILAEGGEINSKTRKTLYTHGGRDAKGTRKGWSLEGLKRYNTIHKELKEVRNSGNSELVDQRLKLQWKEEKNKPVPRHHDTNENTNEQQEEDNFEPVFDFDD